MYLIVSEGISGIYNQARVAWKQMPLANYPFDHVIVNGRVIQLQDIIRNALIPASEFETSLFAFIREWAAGSDNFELSTSGSTGAPKSIKVTRIQMQTSAAQTAEALQLRKGGTALLCLNAGFIAGKMMIVRAFETGMKLIAIEPSSDPLRQIDAAQQIDLCAMVPLQVHDMVRGKSGRLNQIKSVIIGGGSLDAATIAMLRPLGCACYATYGMTETISHIALKRLNGEHPEDFFTTLPGITVGIDDRQCLTIQWPALPEVIVTNDVVELFDNTHFRWMGRWDNVINTGGLKVIPEIVEGKIAPVLNRLEIRNRFFVARKDDERLGDKVIMVLEGSLDNSRVNSIRIALASVLESHERPRDFYTTVQFQETITGKINRKGTIDHTPLIRCSSD